VYIAQYYATYQVSLLSVTSSHILRKQYNLVLAK